MKNEERIISISKMADIKENPLIYEEKKIWSKSYSSATAVLFVCWGNISMLLKMLDSVGFYAVNKNP